MSKTIQGFHERKLIFIRYSCLGRENGIGIFSFRIK